MSKQRNETLQALCRDYLLRLRYMAKKHGIDVDGIIRANKRNECEATNKEVEMLARCVIAVPYPYLHKRKKFGS